MIPSSGNLPPAYPPPLTNPDERRAAIEAKAKPPAKGLRLVCSVVLLLGLAATLIAGGHGVAPIGVILVFGRDVEWLLLLTSIGFLILALGDWLREPKVSGILGLLGLGLLVYVWIVFVSDSEDVGIAMISGALFPVAGLFKLGQVVRAFLRARPSKRVAFGVCARCGYDLRATPRRCPECGTAA